MNAPAVIPSGRPDPSVAKLRRPPVKVSAFAGSWDEVATVVGLSAETPMLEATPAPREPFPAGRACTSRKATSTATTSSKLSVR